MAQNRDDQINDAFTRAFGPSDEPVMWFTVLASVVIATLNYLDVTGRYQLGDAELALLLGWINAAGFIVRSQYTPYKHRAQ